MLIESNRLHQKIKRLKDELARERELRKEAERQLKICKESELSSDIVQRIHNLEITEPTNIGLVIGFSIFEELPRSEENGNRSTCITKKIPEATENLNETRKNMICAGEEATNLFNKLSKIITEENTTEIRKFYKEYFERSKSYECFSSLRNTNEQHTEKFISLCEELYYRETKVCSQEAWNIYQKLFLNLPSFNFFPDIWIFDIIDRFVFKYQYTALTTQDENWNKNAVIIHLTWILTQPSTKFRCSAFLGLLKIYIFVEDNSAILELLNDFEIEYFFGLDFDVQIRELYKIAFAYLLVGKCSEASNCFMALLESLKNILMDENTKETATKYNEDVMRCLAFSTFSNSKSRRNVPKPIVSTIENTYKTDIEDWKDGKIERFWNFFFECSPYICRQEPSSREWKAQNLKNIKFCLKNVTRWKPMRNLKGLLKMCDVLEMIPKSIMPMTTDSDIRFFCDNNNGLLRLVNSKSSGIEKVLQDFPNIHQKETLTLLIMQYHKILRKQKSEEKVLAFGRKFVNVLKKIGYSGSINVDDAMCYIREVSKISMEAANKLVEDQYKF
ncbi:hypothetical protein L5515_016026 [Caenorhabditis briggsae]|uniref:Uncharacterized protein n=1 Tax=Caenorhabditis briggsae TaxID=6238 RepID=A0AAE9J8U1_CAEBR|nr:hypothetical protein L5515_016026 [Caenorhabditis briggsae]